MYLHGTGVEVFEVSPSLIEEDGHTEEKEFVACSSEKKECSLSSFLLDNRKSTQRTVGSPLY